MNKTKKDFGSLFITNTANKKNEFNNDDEIIREIDPSKCFNWKYADRQDFEMGDLHELASNISENGQVQPIVVRESGDKYEVIAGERRWRACSLINIKVKAVIKDLSDEEAFILQAAENKKQSLSPYSQSISYYKILSDEKISQRELAKKLGISKSTLNNLMSYSSVSPLLWEAVGDMKKVTIKTACFIRNLLEESPNSLGSLISIASEIRKGAASAKIKKLIEDDGIDTKKVFYSKDNQVLLKVDSKKIVLPISTLSEEKVNNLINYIQSYFDKE